MDVKPDIVTIDSPWQLRIARKKKKNRGIIVTKSNDMARAEISKVESVLFGRLMNIFISQLQRDDKDFKDYTLPMVALMPEGQRSGQYYEAIEKQAQQWQKVTITLRPDKEQTTIYALFSKIDINRRTNLVTVNIHRDLKPHLLELKHKFTQFSLQEYIKLSTVKTQRLFELLSSWRDKIQVTIALDRLHDILGCEDYMRKNSKEFRVRVLEPSHKEILEHTSLYYEWELKKTGRRVTSVIFNFIPKTPTIAEILENNN